MSGYDNYKGKDILNTSNYDASIYVRLSKEDIDKEKDVSESIKNQKNMLINFCLEQGWNISKIYCDEDFSGADNERPEFNQLLQDAEERKFNLVLCKSQHRFTRDMEVVEKYIHNKFKEWNIRFVSITDHADTLDKGNKKSRQINGLINEWYLEDLSENIRKTFDTKRKVGEFIGAFAPYGYVKDPSNKNKFLIDYEVKDIVKRIFDMYVSGVGREKIARTLNDEGVPCPAKYKQTNCNYKNTNIKNYLWGSETIKIILTNPVYIGNMTQKRQEKISYKSSKFRKIPKKDWIIVENTHEPIIEKEIFDVVQTMISKKSYGKREDRVEHLLGGLLVCGDCGRKATFRRNEKKRFITICSNYTKPYTEEMRCTRHAIIEKDIEAFVIDDLKAISKKVIKNKNEFIGKIQKPKIKENKNNKSSLINNKENRMNEIKKIRKSLYEDKVKGIITEEEFLEYSPDYNKEMEQLSDDIVRLQNEIDSVKEIKSDCDFYKILEQIVDFTIIDKAILMQLINRIEIFEDKTVKVHYEFAKP